MKTETKQKQLTEPSANEQDTQVVKSKEENDQQKTPAKPLNKFADIGDVTGMEPKHSFINLLDYIWPESFYFPKEDRKIFDMYRLREATVRINTEKFTKLCCLSSEFAYSLSLAMYIATLDKQFIDVVECVVYNKPVNELSIDYVIP